jgi:hypothetical protein
MKIREKLGRIQTFILLHDVMCSGGQCICSVRRVAGTVREIRVPSSLTILARATVPIDQRIQTLPDVVAAATRGDIEIIDEPVVAATSDSDADLVSDIGDAPGGKRTSRARK